jgi:hypothetical protein
VLVVAHGVALAQQLFEVLAEVLPDHTHDYQRKRLAVLAWWRAA